MEDCIFCKIAQKEIPADIVYEDEQFVVFHDIRPKASLHMLFVPKKHMESINHVQEEDRDLMGDLILLIQKIAKQRNIEGYRLQVNVGRKGGQEVDHLHIHFMADQNS